MNSESDKAESSSGKFLKTVQPLRDPESNWTVDLAKNLEDYLLQICSGQISAYEDDAIFSVNFAEAALLLQGSVQVYSRKVEYLYSLVLHALDFISQKSQDNQAEGVSASKGSTGVHTSKQEEDDQFWVSDDIPVEAKIILDNETCKDPPSHFLRPPANLVVLEGECLDSGDAGELESYLLGSSNLYRDFILLDSCDAVAVDSFLDQNGGREPTSVFRGNSVNSKSRKSKTFLSPFKSGGAGQKFSAKKTQDNANLPQSPMVDHGFEPNCDLPESPDRNDDFGMGDQYSEPGDLYESDDDDDDPWKPLNPHATGNLKVKPFKKVKANTSLQVGLKKHHSLTSELPLAKLCGPISTDLTEIWEARFGATERLRKSQSLYEKLRESLFVEKKTNEAFDNPENNSEDNGYDSGDPDTGPPDFDMPDTNTFNNEDIPPCQEKHDDPDAHADLEDLCRSHLDALLATLAENEKQTEMATRVSTWKQRIEQDLEEQDVRPPFDIHKYGERVLNKLSTGGDAENKALSFGDVVKGQEKHDVARTFSALLQLVNNGDVDLMRNSPNSTSTCHSDVNPFFVQLLKNERKKGILLQSSKKRTKSPIAKAHGKVKSGKGKENGSVVITSSPQGSNSSCRFSVSLGKPSSRSRCTPEGKKRRKSRLVAPLDMQFVE